MKLFLILCLLIKIVCSTSIASTPVIIWSNTEPDWELSSALQQLKYEAFEAAFLGSYGSENVLILMQDELSVEDLSGNSQSFSKVEDTLKDRYTLYIPSVENPSHLPNDLLDVGYNVIKVGFNDVGTVVLKKNMRNAVVVQLPATSGSPDRKIAIQKAGESITKIISKILTLGEFNIMLTGIHPYEQVKKSMLSQVSHSVRKRSALSNSTAVSFKTECVLIYLTKDLMFVENSTSHILPNSKMTKAVGDCSNSTSAIQLNYAGLQLLGDLSVKLNFKKRGLKKWSLGSAEIVRTANKGNKAIVSAPRSLIYVNIGYSYVCDSRTLLTSNATAKGRAANKLLIRGMQVQAFSKGAEKFSLAVDCVGFFTIAIWSGLITCIMLVLILAWGFYMLSDLKTMDRFDDPKAKPLVVNSSD